MKNYRYNKEIYPPHNKKTMCKICHITDNTQTGDLDDEFHKGFTIGKNGRTMYWEIVWHQSGHATVYAGIGHSGRWVNGDSEITIHWK